MPARRGHEVSLIVTPGKTPRVLGLANWTALDGANYVRTDSPALLRPRDELRQGLSPWEQSRALAADYAEFIVAQLDTAVPRPKNVVLVGVSDGALPAVKVAVLLSEATTDGYRL